MLIIKNAAIYSVGIDGSEVRAETVAADGGKIVYVGTNEGVKAFESSGANVIDARGRTVLPGLCDAHVHASWSGSAKYSCDLFYLENVTGKRTRNVVAHVMLVQPEDFTRMAENDIIACVQPTWTAMTKGEYATMRLALGKKRSEQLYPYGRFLKAGAMVSAGTDFPVMPPPDPFIDMQHAMTRRPCRRFKDYDNSKDFMLAPKKTPMQDVVGLADVIKSRTICGAYQSFAEEYAGSIEVGKSADFAILDRDIFSTPVEDICETKVMTTVFKGEIVYEREGVH